MSEEKTHVTHSSEKVQSILIRYKQSSRSQDTKMDEKGLQRVWVWKSAVICLLKNGLQKLHEYLGAFKIKRTRTAKENWKPLHRGALMPLMMCDLIMGIIQKSRFVQLRQIGNQHAPEKFHSIMLQPLVNAGGKYNLFCYEDV